MNRLRTVKHFIDSLIALVAVSMLLVRLSGVGPSNWFFKRYRDVKDILLGETVSDDFILVIGVVYIAISIIYFILRLILPKTQSDYIRVLSDKGEINFELNAVEDALARTLRERPEIEDVRVKISIPNEKGPIQVTSIVRVWDKPNLVGVTERLQNVMQHRFAEILDLEEDVKVNFNIQVRKLSVKAEETPSPRENLHSTGMPTEEDTHYFGAQYPVDPDEEDED